MAAPAGVEAYLAACPADSRAALENLRATIKAAAPETTETTSHQMPAFKAHGRILVWYTAFQGPLQPVLGEHGAHRGAPASSP